VLDAFERTTGVPADSLAPSRRVLHEYGNMSSASVLFTLEETLRSCSPAAGELGIVCSFGAGFSAFAGLIRFG
jgi:alkylresorcinol/alkylpyrone synthase